MVIPHCVACVVPLEFKWYLIFALGCMCKHGQIRRAVACLQGDKTTTTNRTEDILVSLLGLCADAKDRNVSGSTCNPIISRSVSLGGQCGRHAI